MNGTPTRYLDGLPRPGRALVMGVLNVTPDSFSDGGQWFGAEPAIAHGRRLLADGADIVDVGGESTRPGAERPDFDEELRRVVPVVRALVDAGAVVSIDTMRAEVASAAVQAGAVLVNDVSGGLADPAMLPFVAESGAAYACMHWRGHSATMDELAVYDDVVREVSEELRARVEDAMAAGVPPQRLAIDPGLGFAKRAEHNWQLLAALDRLAGLGLPVLVGASRKRFLGSLLADPVTGTPRAVGDRVAAGVAVAALSARAGVWCVRSHDVRDAVDAVTVAARWGEYPR